MQTATDLRNLLARIDRKGYPAYKDTKGAYQFPDYVLSIDHVQGDPFAAPSKVSIHVRGSAAAFPPSLYRTPVQRIALQDALTVGSPGRRKPYPSGPRARDTAGRSRSAAAGRRSWSAPPAVWTPSTVISACAWRWGSPPRGGPFRPGNWKKFYLTFSPSVSMPPCSIGT